MQPKHTTAPPQAQLSIKKPPCRYEANLDCIISPIWFRLRVIDDGRSVFVSDPILQKQLALELTGMLVPQFPGCEIRITETGGITREVDEFTKMTTKRRDRIVASRSTFKPGLAYLLASGYAPRNADIPDRGAAVEGFQ